MHELAWMDAEKAAYRAARQPGPQFLQAFHCERAAQSRADAWVDFFNGLA
jgi:hypothetical protein